MDNWQQIVALDKRLYDLGLKPFQRDELIRKYVQSQTTKPGIGDHTPERLAPHEL